MFSYLHIYTSVHTEICSLGWKGFEECADSSADAGSRGGLGGGRGGCQGPLVDLGWLA